MSTEWNEQLLHAQQQARKIEQSHPDRLCVVETHGRPKPTVAVYRKTHEGKRGAFLYYATMPFEQVL